MTIDALDHFTVAVSDLEASRRFYVEALGLHEGERPPFEFPGAWLYSGAAPLVHLVAPLRLQYILLHQSLRDCLSAP